MVAIFSSHGSNQYMDPNRECPECGRLPMRIINNGNGESRYWLCINPDCEWTVTLDYDEYNPLVIPYAQRCSRCSRIQALHPNSDCAAFR